MDDLTPGEHIALKEHLAMCRACSEVYVDYQTLDCGIRSLLACEGASFISHPSPQRVRKAPNIEIILADIPSLLSALLTSLFASIVLSNVYLKLHYWLLLMTSFFSQKIAYVKTSSHHLYAIRSESGFMVWKQESYQKHNLLYTVPVRMVGINCFSWGTAYLSAADFCRYTARA